MATSVALRGSQGIWIVNGAPGHDSTPLHVCDEDKTCKVMAFTNDGYLMAWATASKVYIMDIRTRTVQHQLQQTRVADMRFSPKGSVLATWGPYLTDREGKAGEPNLITWNVESGIAHKAFVQKKQISWEPQWSFDEVICGRIVNNELHFFENNNFDSIQNKLHLQKVMGFSITQGPSPYIISAYVAGAKGQPSYVRLYQYPNFGGPAAAVANKSFYKADRVHMYWNKIGTGLVILTSTESSDSSYYGEQGLHYISTDGVSCLVPLDKKGPVYTVMWSPRHVEFCVVFGYMPSKATLFNMKCEPVFDFGTGPRNHCFYNPHGNSLAGFGNLAGHVEFWDLKQKKEISRFKAPDTTNFLWSPDGEYILTATVSPRLRVGNGYKLWHYTGSLLAHVPTPDGHELWDVQWLPVSEGTFSEKPVCYKTSEPGLDSPENVKTEAYRPPQARIGSYTPAAKLHEYEPASNIRQAQASAGKPASKNKKKRDARKAKTTTDGEQEEADREEPASVAGDSASASTPSTGDPEKDKKIRNIKKKIQQIEKLKDHQKSGKHLELNQLEKLKTEAALLQELEDLELG